MLRSFRSNGEIEAYEFTYPKVVLVREVESMFHRILREQHCAYGETFLGPALRLICDCSNGKLDYDKLRDKYLNGYTETFIGAAAVVAA